MQEHYLESACCCEALTVPIYNVIVVSLEDYLCATVMGYEDRRRRGCILLAHVAAAVSGSSTAGSSAPLAESHQARKRHRRGLKHGNDRLG